MGLEEINRHGNLSVVKSSERAFPGVLIQGDTLATLLEDLEDELPAGHATRTVREWIRVYEDTLFDAGMTLPYIRE